MKVLEKKKLSGEIRSMEVICTGEGHDKKFACGSKLLVTADDIYRTLGEYDVYEGYPHFFTTLCPVCETETNLSDVPPVIQRAVKDRINKQITRYKDEEETFGVDSEKVRKRILAEYKKSKKGQTEK